MNVFPELLPIVADLQKRFSGRLEVVHSQHNEVYIHAQMELVAGFTAHLYRQWKARLVSVFADDARESARASSVRASERAPAGCFHLYYVFAIDAAHGFIILRIPIAPEKPEFLSLTNAIHSVN